MIDAFLFLDPEAVGPAGPAGPAGPTILPIDASAMVRVCGNWQFEADLLDSSGNGYNLQDSLSSLWMKIDEKWAKPTRQATLINEIAAPGLSPLLQITGELTVHVLVRIGAAIGAQAYLFGFGGVGETEPPNYLYALRVNTTGDLEYFHESGGGIDRVVSWEASIPVGKWTLVTVTRDVAGTGVVLYLDGQQIATGTTLTPPTGGTLSKFLSSAIVGHLGGIVVCANQQSGAEILAVAQQVGVAA